MGTPYRECPNCGAHLDAGEPCDCAQKERDPRPAGRAGKRGGTVNCAICGKPVERVRPCEYYRRRGEAVCDECCEECYRTEPFPCPDHDQREELEG